MESAFVMYSMVGQVRGKLRCMVGITIRNFVSVA